MLRIAIGLIFFAILFGAIRLVLGKTLIDRIVAIDFMDCLRSGRWKCRADGSKL